MSNNNDTEKLNTQEPTKNNMPEALDKENNMPKTPGNNDLIQPEKKGSEQEGPRVLVMGSEKRQGILGKIWNALEQIPIIGLLFKAIGAIFSALFGGGQSSNQMVMIMPQVPEQVLEQETVRSGPTQTLEGKDPNKEVAATEKKDPGVAQNNLKSGLNPEKVAEAAAGLQGVVEPDISNKSSKAPDKTPANAQLEAKQEKADGQQIGG